jgi:hypothetical protein
MAERQAVAKRNDQKLGELSLGKSEALVGSDIKQMKEKSTYVKKVLCSL